MIGKIEKKFIYTNILIMVLSLAFLCLAITVGISRLYMRNARIELRKENEVAMNLVLKDVDVLIPVQYNKISEIIHILYVHDEQGGEVRYLTSGVLEKIDVVELRDKVESIIRDDLSSINEVEIKSLDFLLIQSTEKQSETGKNITVISIIPVNDIQTVYTQNMNLLILMLLITVAVATPVIYVVSRKISKPILDLTDTTLKYSKRDFSNEIRISTNDEIEILAESIAVMRDSLVQYESEQADLYRSISHDIKTPLTAIYGYAEGVKNGTFDKSKLEIIMNETLRVKKLIEDSILLSKLERNIEVFSLRKENLYEVIVEAIEKIESIAILNDIEIMFEPDSTEVILEIDKGKILRSIINILSNALKYTKTRIVVNLIDKDGVMILDISDDGPGFDPDTLEGLFSELATEKSDGNGIGLTIAQKIMARHGGSMKVENLNIGAKISLIFKKSSG